MYLESRLVVRYDGRLIAEHDGSTGAVLREYIYYGFYRAAFASQTVPSSLPVAMIAYDALGGAEVNAVHTDQVNMPQKLTDASGVVVHDRVTTPFGQTISVTGTLTQTLRFPGQRNDSETGLFQNWHRDYDASLGRYVQSDPIGLAGGINTYAYVGGNPVTYVDPTGEVGLSAAGGAIGGNFLKLRGFRWKGFSKAFGNVSKRYRNFLQAQGRAPTSRWELHHAIIPNNGWGRFVPNSIKNHPLNLKPLLVRKHRRIHGRYDGLKRFSRFGRWWHGTPDWAKIAQLSIPGGITADKLNGGNCKCKN